MWRLPNLPMARAVPTLLVAALACAPGAGHGHGGVVLEDDVCVIQIGYFKAHFKIYLPQERGHDDFCEDIPTTGEAVFVMEFLHEGLRAAPIDFRIIRNVTGLGLYAQLSDVEAMTDLEAVTVFHQPPVNEPDVYSIVHTFEDPGEFIGIVSAIYPETGKVYRAVFPFEVGFTGFGYWPLIAVMLLVLQLNYWYMSGHLSRWRQRWVRAGAHPEPAG
jgi:hypothetical protein